MSSQDKAKPWPVDIILNKDKNALRVIFDNSDDFEVSSELLRVYSPSAEIKGHGSEPRKIIGGKKNVKIVNVEPVGNYAVRLVYDDGHDSGIYTWDYLHELAGQSDMHWEQYLKDLENNGLIRD